MIMTFSLMPVRVMMAVASSRVVLLLDGGLWRCGRASFERGGRSRAVRMTVRFAVRRVTCGRSGLIVRIKRVRWESGMAMLWMNQPASESERETTEGTYEKLL